MHAYCLAADSGLTSKMPHHSTSPASHPEKIKMPHRTVHSWTTAGVLLYIGTQHAGLCSQVAQHSKQALVPTSSLSTCRSHKKSSNYLHTALRAREPQLISLSKMKVRIPMYHCRTASIVCICSRGILICLFGSNAYTFVVVDPRSKRS